MSLCDRTRCSKVSKSLMIERVDMDLSTFFMKDGDLRKT